MMSEKQRSEVKLENHDKETPKRSLYATYQRTFLKQLSKRTFEPSEEIQILKKTCADKVINVVQLLFQSERETYCCC